MKEKDFLRQLALVFGVALVVYMGCYTGIEYWRTRRGPWLLEFTNSPAGSPGLLINQPSLAISNLWITFPGRTFPSNQDGVSLSFQQPRTVPYDVPFGSCVFMDTTSLPGTLAFKMFGHEIQLLPRVLTIDKMEVPWRSRQEISLPGTNLPETSFMP